MTVKRIDTADSTLRLESIDKKQNEKNKKFKTVKGKISYRRYVDKKYPKYTQLMPQVIFL